MNICPEKNRLFIFCIWIAGPFMLNFNYNSRTLFLILLFALYYYKALYFDWLYNYMVHVDLALCSRCILKKSYKMNTVI